MEKVWIGLGSNLGDSADYLRKAIVSLGPILKNLSHSAFWRSKARYVLEQPDFINAVACGDTELSPRQLLEALHEIETSLGRNRISQQPKGPRTIDLDILLYGNKIIAEPDLVIPHPLMRERKFVLVPLLELDDSLVDPVSGVRLTSYLQSLPPQGIYPLAADRYDAPCP